MHAQQGRRVCALYRGACAALSAYAAHLHVAPVLPTCTRALQVLPKPPNATRPPIMRSMSYNPAENALLINSEEEGGTYRFYQLPAGAPATLASRGEVPETFSGQGATAVFIARNRFAVWNRFSSVIQACSHRRMHRAPGAACIARHTTRRCADPQPAERDNEALPGAGRKHERALLCGHRAAAVPRRRQGCAAGRAAACGGQ
jgi:hypothetical protein